MRQSGEVKLPLSLAGGLPPTQLTQRPADGGPIAANRTGTSTCRPCGIGRRAICLWPEPESARPLRIEFPAGRSFERPAISTQTRSRPPRPLIRSPSSGSLIPALSAKHRPNRPLTVSILASSKLIVPTTWKLGESPLPLGLRTILPRNRALTSRPAPRLHPFIKSFGSMTRLRSPLKSNQPSCRQAEKIISLNRVAFVAEANGRKQGSKRPARGRAKRPHAAPFRTNRLGNACPPARTDSLCGTADAGDCRAERGTDSAGHCCTCDCNRRRCGIGSEAITRSRGFANDCRSLGASGGADAGRPQ